jgi:DNA invertase Pin-like site-specific DNA recombinase
MGGGARLQGRGQVRLHERDTARLRLDDRVPLQRAGDELIARHHDRLTRNPNDVARLMHVCGRTKIKISLSTGGELDLSIPSGGFYWFVETGRSWYESAIRSQRVKDSVERNARAGKRTGGGSRPFSYKIIRP